jgi:hypothetical protein
MSVVSSQWSVVYSRMDLASFHVARAQEPQAHGTVTVRDFQCRAVIGKLHLEENPNVANPRRLKSPASDYSAFFPRGASACAARLSRSATSG